MTIPSTTDDLIAEIEATAKAATPGEREWVEDRFNGGWSGLYAGDEPVIVPQCRNEGDTGAAWFADEADADECGLSDGDRQFMEVASPANVLTLIARIRELEQAQRWTPCSERLPEVRERLDSPLTSSGGHEVLPLNISVPVIYYDGNSVKSGPVNWFDGGAPLSGVTHWMPLPGRPT